MKKIIIILSLFFTLFSFTPSLFEIIQSSKIPPDRVFVLEHNYMFDYNFYLSRIREGQEGPPAGEAGRWTVVEKYYNQPHAGSLFQIFYLTAGKIGGFIGLTPPFIYHALRIILGFILLVLIGLYARNLLSGWFAILAYLFVVTAASWPILIKIGPPASQFYRFATYMGYWSAVDSLQRITFLPHVLLGQIFILLFIWRFGGGGDSLSHKSPKLLRLLMLGAVGLIAGIIFPPTLIVVYAYFFVLSAMEIFTKSPKSLKLLKIWVKEKGIQRIFFILLSMPSLFYLQVMFRIWPWKALALFDVLHRMPLDYKEYFLALGPVLPLGIIGLVIAVIKREKKLFPVISWVLSVFLLFAVFEKVPTQSPLRFTEALIHIPLGILTAYLFYSIWQKNNIYKRSHVYVMRMLRGIVVVSIIIIVTLGFGVMISMIGWLTDQGRAKKEATWVVPIGAQLSYPLKDFMDGIYYLRDNTKIDDVVLTYITAGNFIPAYAGNFVYIGHANTPDEDGKEKIAARFFSGKMSQKEAKEFLIKERISYIFFGPQERELGSVKDLAIVYPFIKSVYGNNQVLMYQVR